MSMSNDLLITSKTTGLLVELRPPGGGGAGPRPRVEMVLRLAMTECHAWLGIGGRSGRVRRPRRMSREKTLPLDVRRSGDACRRRIGRAIKGILRDDDEYRGLTLAHWDRAVPHGVERAIAVAVQRRGGGGAAGGSTLKVIVDIEVRFKFVYCEAKALLLACDDGNSGGSGPAAGNGDGDGDGDAPPSCSICFAEMSRDDGEVTDLPGCTHGFHFWCIAPWFHKASTCPVCRQDQRRFLPPDYRDLHAKMTIDPDSLQPEYPSVL